MKKLLGKAKSAFQDPPSNQKQQQQQPFTYLPPQPSSIQPPTPQDILRYRYHHGTNLGSIFVLEKWLHPSMFSQRPLFQGTSELDAVSNSIQEIGLEKTREKWEAHWHNAVLDNAFAWFVNEAKGTSVRLPIGYFTLGEEFCRGTPFEGVRGVYVHAWAAVRAFVTRARRMGVGVLIDLHAVPGGANGEAHSGTGSGKAELWGNRRYLSAAKAVLVRIAEECRGLDGVIGIQLCNEAVWDAKGMYEWYDEVIGEIGKIDPSMPIYVSDGWDLKRCLEWCGGRRGEGNPVVVDTHKYFTFSDADRSQSPQQIIGRIGGELGELDGREGSVTDRGAVQVVVGEWSCVLDGQTWSKVRESEKPELVQQFGRSQSQKWQQRAGGSFFWTWKMDWMEGGEWGFVEQSKKGNILPPMHFTLSPEEVQSRTQAANSQRQQLASSDRQSHEAYWTRTSPGKQFQHDWYSEGWDVGFSDAQKFFTARADGALGEVVGTGGDKIGCLEIWVRKRLIESGRRGEFVWEWEQGFRAGVVAFYRCAGI